MPERVATRRRNGCPCLTAVRPEHCGRQPAHPGGSKASAAHAPNSMNFQYFGAASSACAGRALHSTAGWYFLPSCPGKLSPYVFPPSPAAAGTPPTTSRPWAACGGRASRRTCSSTACSPRVRGGSTWTALPEQACTGQRMPPSIAANPVHLAAKQSHPHPLLMLSRQH